MGLVYFETVANTLFLTQFSVAQLPLVYIITAVISVILGFIYTKLENRLAITTLLQVILLSIFLFVVTFLVLIKFYDYQYAYMGIMIFKDIIWMFSAIEFGILVGVLFDIRQGKRLFGLLMSGEILAGIISV